MVAGHGWVRWDGSILDPVWLGKVSLPNITGYKMAISATVLYTILLAFPLFQSMGLLEQVGLYAITQHS